VALRDLVVSLGELAAQAADLLVMRCELLEKVLTLGALFLQLGHVERQRVGQLPQLGLLRSQRVGQAAQLRFMRRDLVG